MLEQIIRIIFFAVFSVVQAYIIKKLIGSKINLFTVNNILSLVLLTILDSLTYQINYSVYSIILRVLISIMVYHQIFHESLFRMIIAYIINMFIITIIDLIVYLPFIGISVDMYRNTWYFILATNTVVAITSIIFVRNAKIIYKIKDLIKQIKHEQQKTLILFYSLSFLTIITIFYKLVEVYNFNYEFWIDVFIVAVLLIISIIFINDRIRYNGLLNEYDVLQNYYKEFENIIDDVKINVHEYKNQLVIIENYINEGKYDKAINLIKDLSNSNQEYDASIIMELKNIPDGGIKSLLYYKLIIAKNLRLNISINVSQNVSKKMKKISENDIKIISRLIGIYLDNAIEASKESYKKLLSVELYMLDKELYFTFANTYNIRKYDYSKIGKKGYTTKGKGHGNGLYLANRILERNSWIKAKTSNINKMYVQQIIIKKDH